jgi:hypothetical protein
MRLQMLHSSTGILGSGPGGEVAVQLGLVLQAAVQRGEFFCCGPGGVAKSMAEALPLGICGHSNDQPGVFSLAGVAVMGGHGRMVIAHGGCIAAIHRRIHKKLTDVRQHIFRLRKVDELTLASALPVVQGT